jgi:hypothetical protein
MQALEEHADVRSLQYGQAARDVHRQRPAREASWERYERLKIAARRMADSKEWNKLGEIVYRAWRLTAKR